MSIFARSIDFNRLLCISAFLTFTASPALAAGDIGETPEDAALIEADEAVAGAHGIEAEAQKFAYESRKEKARAKAATVSAASAKASATRNEREAKTEITKAESEITAYRLAQKRAKAEEKAADRAYAQSQADIERWRAKIAGAMRASETAQARASVAVARAHDARAEAVRLGRRAALDRGLSAQPLSLARDCNMRAEPNVNGPVVLQVMKGSSVVTAASSAGESRKWVRASLGDHSASGYIADSCFSKKIGRRSASLR